MRTKLLLTLLCVFGLQTIETLAQPRQTPLPVEEVLAALHFRYGMAVDLTPDGVWAAFTLQDDRRRERPTEGYASVHFTHTGVIKALLGCDIWVTNTQTGESKNLTEGKGSSWSPVWSPDGTHLAFFSDRSGAARLWVWERSSGKLRQLSEEIVHSLIHYEGARWSPDGRSVLVKVLPAGMTIEGARDAITSPQITEERGAHSPTVLVYRSSAGQGAAAERNLYDNGESIRNRRRADLALIEVATGKVRRIVTGFNPAWYGFSPDGGKVAFTDLKGYEPPQSRQMVYDLVVVSLSDARPRVIAPSVQLDFAGATVSWSPDGKMLSFITTTDSGGPAKGDCFVVPVSGGEPRNATPAPHPYFSNALRAPLWDAAGERIYLLSVDSVWKVNLKENSAEVVATIPGRRIIEAVAPREGGRFWSPDGGRSMIVTTRDERAKQDGFYQVDLNNGNQTKLLEERKSYGDRPISNIDVSSDGKQVVFVAEDAGHSAEIWLATVDFKNPRRVTRINPQLDKYAMGTSRLIEWQSIDGETMRGALLLPANYQEGKRYPLIVSIYPNARLSDFANKFGLNPFGASVENMQLFATRGYAVLLADSFRPKVDPMLGVAKTVLPGVSKLVEIGIADPDRLGVIGHSNGGYGVLSLIVQTTRFKAAVCRGGYGNSIGFYSQMARDGSSWAVNYAEQYQNMGGPPWRFPNKYIEDSPLFYLDRVQTPLLLVHGAEDTSVPSFLADEIFVGLRRLGKEVEYAKYEGEGHYEGNWGYYNQTDYLNRIINWFDKHLNNDQGRKPVVEQSGQSR